MHLKGVEVIDEGIPDPIVDGIVVLAGIDDKSIVAVEVQARETWQGVATCRKIEHEMFQDGTFAFEQVAVLQGRLEGCQDDVIGKIMGVGDIDDRIVVDAVVPYGVGTDVGTAGGAEDALREGDHLGTLVIDIVLVEVFEGKSSILSGGESFDHKMSATVGT